MAHEGKTSGPARAISRRTFIQAATATVGAAALPMPAIAQAKRFAGVTLRAASYQHRFLTILQGYVPEFEQQTGMKVDLQLSAFPAYNKMIAEELSAGGSAFDVVNVTFFLAARWVAAGYLLNLDEFTSDPNLTPPDWKPDDFVDGAQLPYRAAGGGTYGYAWEGGAMVMGISRMDLMARKGLAVPRTFEQLQHVCAEIHGTEDVNGFVDWQLHHWGLMPYLHGFGGNVFRNPPLDVTPTLDSPEAILAVQYYANLLKNYAPRDVLTYTEDRARRSMLAGRSNIFIHSSSWVTPILQSDESRVRETALVTRMPAGPKRNWPAANSQGLGIAKNAKNRVAAWEFIKWALSPEMSRRMLVEHRHSTGCRRSIIQSDAYREINAVKGQDLGALYLDVLELPAKGENYMAYRTVKEFPIVGAAVNRAVERVVTGEASAADAMLAAQNEAEAGLRQAAGTL
jgi:multiple sugar transport system substrate-binding protein